PANDTVSCSLGVTATPAATAAVAAAVTTTEPVTRAAVRSARSRARETGRTNQQVDRPPLDVGGDGRRAEGPDHGQLHRDPERVDQAGADQTRVGRQRHRSTGARERPKRARWLPDRSGEHLLGWDRPGDQEVQRLERNTPKGTPRS